MQISGPSGSGVEAGHGLCCEKHWRHCVAVKDGFNVGTHRDVGSKEGDSSTTLVSKKRISSKYPKLAFKNPKVMKSSGREDGDLPKTEQQVNFSLVS